MENMPIPTTVSCTGDREETESGESQSASVSVNSAALKLKSVLVLGFKFFQHCSNLQCLSGPTTQKQLQWVNFRNRA